MHFEPMPLPNSRQSKRGRFSGKLLTGCSILLGTLSTSLLWAPDAIALDEIRLAYGDFQFGTLAMEELANFATTGEASSDIQALLEVANLDEASALAILNNPIPIENTSLAEVTETFVGESFFQLVGTTVAVPGAVDPSWIYVREAFLTSAADSQVSFIDILQAFEVDSIVLDTERIGPVIERVQNDIQVVRDYFDAASE